jgi:hypothetical protein
MPHILSDFQRTGCWEHLPGRRGHVHARMSGTHARGRLTDPLSNNPPACGAGHAQIICRKQLETSSERQQGTANSRVYVVGNTIIGNCTSCRLVRFLIISYKLLLYFNETIYTKLTLRIVNY